MPSPDFTPPPPRRLFIAWLLLAGLTVTSLLAGLDGLSPTSTASLTPAAVASVLLATALKAREILRVYLNLRASTPGWRGTLTAFVVVIIAAVAGGQAIILALH